MNTLFVLFAFALTLAFIIKRSRPQPAPARRSTATLRITNPKSQGVGVSRLWQLHSNGCTCSNARQLAGRRLDIDDTVALRAGGGAIDCRCYYRPLREARTAQRRAASERRAALRFDLSRCDRRLQGERRQLREAWERMGQMVR